MTQEADTNRTSRSPKPGLDASRRGSGIGAKMAGGNPDPERGRAYHDYYDTPDDVTEALLLRYAHSMQDTLRTWEPCAGRGAMARLIKRAIPGTALFCSDIVTLPETPHGFAVHRVDLTTDAIDGLCRWADLIMTNPPFDIEPLIMERVLGGIDRRKTMVALLSKGTYWHAARRHGLFLNHPPTRVHPLLWRPDFEDLKRGPTMEVAWNVWERWPDGVPVPFTRYEPMPRPHHPRRTKGTAT